MKLSINAQKIKKALNLKGYELVKYNYERVMDGWVIGFYQVEFERIEKRPTLPLTLKKIEEENFNEVIDIINKLPDLTDPFTFQALINMKGNL